MYTLTATSARTELFSLLKKTIKGHIQTRINSKEGSAILISEEDYESLLETSELLSIKGLKASIKKADKDIENNNVYSIDEAFS